MTAKFLQIDLDDAQPGMILSDALLDAHGGVLLPAGTELSEGTIKSLQRRGVDKLVIVNDRLSEAELAEERERLQQRLDRLFRKSGKAGADAELLRHVTRYRMGAA